ncbi:flagellar hook-length control protein FliK [Luminiphilus sp.]|nr:flagellar hook-length control protein FliK [Luminiphilus sp.]
MDSQIGSDIAKLLGNLGKSTVSSPKTDSNSDAGAAFKRALAASEGVRSQVATGKQLPAASVTQQASSANTPPASALTPNESVVEQAMTHTPLPGFDLLVVGDPVEQSAILKFAQASGLSQAAVAELFSAGANDAANLSAPEGALAQAVANWMAANQGAESPKGTDSLESMAEDINAAIVALFAGAAENDKASLSTLANALAAEMQPVIERWRALSGSAATPAEALAQQLQAAIQPVAAQWMADHPAIAATTDVSEDKLVTGLVETVLPVTMSPMASELESVVSRWLEQTPQFDKSAVSAQWLRDLSGSVMPDMAKWLAASADSRGSVSQLAANIAPQIAQALQALPVQASSNSPELNRLVADMAPAAVRDVPTLASMNVIQSAALMGVTQPELAAAKASALSQPQPISVAIAGGEWESGSSKAKPLTSMLMQVTTPVANPGLTEATVISQATLDRFAVRSAGMRSESATSSIKQEALMGADGVKTANVQTVTALRDIVTARTLELARLGAQIEKPATGSPSTPPQAPFAGLVSGEVADTSAARLAGQNEISFRQNLASAGASDAARSNQFSLNQNPAGREMAGRALSEALGQRLAANIAAGHYRLTFNVNPKELGAIDVVMEMRDGRLDAQINASNAVTRELLGDSLSRLRDALQQNGINLAQLQVGSDSQQGNAQGRNNTTDGSQDQIADERLLADAAADVVSEDIELGLDLDSVDFWA